MKARVKRKGHFNAAHRLHRPDWSNEKNEAIFGLCSNPLYHGHNYNLTVEVGGEIDPETGFVMDLKLLKNLIENEICKYLDHKNLNEQIPEFKELNPTAENISVIIWNKLRPKIPQHLSLEVELFETERNSVVYKGD
ncbi:MAG: 6-carboxytetrahydropterin synthase [Flavobacteriales bacterium]|nr:6-carboxytetrahydropterin synthase [Flavobacteriales bacterium]